MRDVPSAPTGSFLLKAAACVPPETACRFHGGKLVEQPYHHNTEVTMAYYCSKAEQQRKTGRETASRMREQRVVLSHRKARNVSSPSSSRPGDDTDNKPQEHYRHPQVTIQRHCHSATCLVLAEILQFFFQEPAKSGTIHSL